MTTISRPNGDWPGYRDACVELKGKLRSGEPARVEDVLAGNPSLADDQNAVLELILAEVSTRSEMGERPSVVEWEQRISQLIPDVERRAAVQNLLVSEMTTLRESPATPAEPALRSRRGHPPMTRIGKYQILEEIGRGGMGIVYKARQTNLNRIVALKMILTGEQADQRERARLRKEAEATATLDHPNIVKIFDIGEHEGMPYLEMEYVSGGNLTRMLRSLPQPIRWSARLTETVARAIHVAHERGIVHRDLNPSNILMTTDGVPKITDFGLAKFLHSDAGISQHGLLVGTPGYMAPEQVASGRNIGPTVDVYAIGIMLYELLTGAPPFRGLTPMETLYQVMDGEVVPPSRLRHGLPVDLETICLKCLARNPAQRYPDAQELADDLRRFQGGEPILARRTPRLRRAAQWARRQPLAAALLGLSLTLLATLLVVAAGYNIHLQALRRILDAREEKLNSKEVSIRWAKKRAEREQRDSLREHYDAQLSRVYDHLQRNETDVAIEIFDVLNQDLPAAVGFEWRYINGLIHRSERILNDWSNTKASIDCVAVSEDGQSVASGASDGGVLLWDVAQETSTRFRLGIGAYSILEVALACDASGKAVALAAVSLDVDQERAVSIWDVSKPNVPWTFQDRLEKTADLAFTHDGRRLALRCRRSGRTTWESWSRRLVDGEWTNDPAAARDGVECQTAAVGADLLALGLEDGTIIVRDAVADRELPRPAKSGRPIALAFTEDGTKLAVGREDRSIVVWDLASNQPIAELTTSDGPPTFLGFCRGDQSLVVSEGEATVAIHDLQTPTTRRVLPTRRNPTAMAVSRRGDRLAVGADTEPVSLWDLRSIPDGPRQIGRLSDAKHVLFSPDGENMFITYRDPMIRVWRMREAPNPRIMLAGHVKEAWAVAFSRDGTVLASGADDSLIKLWDVASGRQLAAVLAHEQTVSGLAFSPVRDELASVSLDGSLKIWSLARDASKSSVSLTLKRTLHQPNPSQLRCVAYSVDGELVAAAGKTPEILICRPSDSRPPQRISAAHDEMITALAFSPTNRDQLASASCDASFKLWNIRELEWRSTRPTNGSLMALAFSPIGDRLSAAGLARLVSSLDTKNRSDQDDVIGHPEAVRSLAFSIDGQTIATACDDGKVRLCDTWTNQVVISLDGHHARVNSVAFSPDGRTLASCSHSGEVFLWNGGDPDLGPRPRPIDQPTPDDEPSDPDEADEIVSRP